MGFQHISQNLKSFSTQVPVRPPPKNYRKPIPSKTSEQEEANQCSEQAIEKLEIVLEEFESAIENAQSNVSCPTLCHGFRGGDRGASPTINDRLLVSLSPHQFGLGGKILGAERSKFCAEGAVLEHFSDILEKLFLENAMKIFFSILGIRNFL